MVYLHFIHNQKLVRMMSENVQELAAKCPSAAHLKLLLKLFCHRKQLLHIGINWFHK